MSYFLNFMRVWALSLLTTLGPLQPPVVLLDAVDRHWIALAVSKPPSEHWDLIEARGRKDPLGAFQSFGQRPWYGYQFWSWIFQGLETNTTYEIQIRALEVSSGRYSGWVGMTVTTMR